MWRGDSNWVAAGFLLALSLVLFGSVVIGLAIRIVYIVITVATALMILLFYLALSALFSGVSWESGERLDPRELRKRRRERQHRVQLERERRREEGKDAR